MEETLSMMLLIGFPSVFAILSGIIFSLYKYVRKMNILMAAQKAQMRAQLLKDYRDYMKRGYVLDIELEEWQNQYKAYHELVGENGVLDDRYKKLLNLPTTVSNI